MILNDIKEALETVDPRVFYGMAVTLSDGDLWDYIVFSRVNLKVVPSKTGEAVVYRVAIVREEFVPEDDIQAVVDAMTGIPGMRRRESDSPFEYTKKPNTNTVVELVALDFVKPRKKF